MTATGSKDRRVDAETGLAACAHPGCDLAGEFRAPRSRDALDSYFWFCLEHVREYNAAWNYYADMDDAAVEAEVRKDIVWRRPTWPLGTRPGPDADRLRDPLGLLGGAEQDGREARAGEAQASVVFAGGTRRGFPSWGWLRRSPAPM